jgi:hypothetical protein
VALIFFINRCLHTQRIQHSAHFVFIKNSEWVTYATTRNITKGYVVEGSTFWLQIENSGFNSSISLVPFFFYKAK